MCEEGRKIEDAAVEQEVQARERFREKPDILLRQLQAVHRLHERRAKGTVGESKHVRQALTARPLSLTSADDRRVHPECAESAGGMHSRSPRGIHCTARRRRDGDDERERGDETSTMSRKAAWRYPIRPIRSCSNGE